MLSLFPVKQHTVSLQTGRDRAGHLPSGCVYALIVDPLQVLTLLGAERPRKAHKHFMLEMVTWADTIPADKIGLQ